MPKVLGISWGRVHNQGVLGWALLNVPAQAQSGAFRLKPDADPAQAALQEARNRQVRDVELTVYHSADSFRFSRAFKDGMTHGQHSALVERTAALLRENGFHVEFEKK